MIVDLSQYAGSCSCGREHRMQTRYLVVEKDALSGFESYMSRFGVSGKRCAIYGENSFRATEGKHPAAEQEIVLCPDGLHADEISTAEVLDRMEDDVEVILAVGSGTIHDIARFCAHKRGIRFVALPTGASVDGFCSTVAAMTWFGYKKTIPAVAPEFVLADTTVLRDAPMMLVRSGVGDIMAKYIALAEWRMAHELTGEYLCQRIYDITKEATDKVMASVPGILAGDEDAYADVILALCMSGIAMQMMGNSRPASGAEHHISHFIEMMPEGLTIRFPSMHGEKTGVGAVLVSREYKRLAETPDLHGRVRAYTPLDRDEICSFFGGKLKNAILEENEKDCLSAVTPEALEEKWQTMREIISEIPSPEELSALLEQLGAKHSLPEIGVDEADLATVFHYSAMVRNRLTLMRAKRMVRFE